LNINIETIKLYRIRGKPWTFHFNAAWGCYICRFSHTRYGIQFAINTGKPLRIIVLSATGSRWASWDIGPRMIEYKDGSKFYFPGHAPKTKTEG